jgi:hypothetical protein
MSKSIVRCRCGHRVLAKEVLRTDLYERRAPEGSDREYVYVKFRCQRCKRVGEAFVAESRWDWSILEPDRNEMSDTERDHFLDEEPISSEEILDFHRRLKTLSYATDLERERADSQGAPEGAYEGTPRGPDTAATLRAGEPGRPLPSMEEKRSAESAIEKFPPDEPPATLI